MAKFKLGSKARHDPITENVMLNICQQFEDENDYDFQQNGAPYDYDSGMLRKSSKYFNLVSTFLTSKIRKESSMSKNI
uniref:Uncharacterized protein n=1 Tax=Glossina palpalis gambiensis TaxID=67801 RepID=A0A1B0AXX5_9MUSC